MGDSGYLPYGIPPSRKRYQFLISVNPESDVEDVWYKLKTSLLDAAKEVYGLPKTIKEKRRPGGGRTRLLKPSSIDANALKPTRL
jgi:hypothetical protein